MIVYVAVNRFSRRVLEPCAAMYISKSVFGLDESVVHEQEEKEEKHREEEHEEKCRGRKRRETQRGRT